MNEQISDRWTDHPLCCFLVISRNFFLEKPLKADRLTDKCMFGSTDRQTKRQANEKTNGQIDGQTNKYSRSDAMSHLNNVL